MWYEGYELRMKNRRKRRRRDRRRRVSPLSPYNPHTQSVQDPTVSEGDHTQRLPVTLAEKGRAARAARCSSSEIWGAALNGRRIRALKTKA